jgi:hypothetical protein
MFMTLTDTNEAHKDHAPDAPGTWGTVENGDCIITWKDGFTDILRPQKNKDHMKVLSFDPGAKLEGPPSHIQFALRQPKPADVVVEKSVELSVYGLKVGACGRPEHIDAKVLQVLDENSMLVAVGDSRGTDIPGGVEGRPYTIMLKCPTAGIVDGKYLGTGMDEVIVKGTQLKVTGTTKYDKRAVVRRPFLS